MFENLTKIKADIEAARAKAKAETQGALKEAFKELFEAHPELSAVRWTQYTPYFNDGDACVFSVHGWSAKVDNVKPSDDEEEGAEEGFADEWDFSKTPVGHDIGKLFGCLDDDAMQAAFGDHSQITATRKGFDVDEYEHD